MSTHQPPRLRTTVCVCGQLRFIGVWSLYKVMFMYVHCKKKLSLNSSNNSYPVSEGFSFSLKRSDSFTILENPLEFSSLSKYVFVVQSVVAPISTVLVLYVVVGPGIFLGFFLCNSMNHSSLGRVVCSLKCYPPLKNVICFIQFWNFVSVVTSLWQVKDTRIGSPTVTFTPGMTWKFSYLSFYFLFPRFTFILSWNFVVNQVNGVW